MVGEEAILIDHRQVLSLSSETQRSRSRGFPTVASSLQKIEIIGHRNRPRSQTKKKHRSMVWT